MKTVRQVLQTKGTTVWSTTPDSPVIEALRLMADKNIGALLVLEDDQIAGIFSERDYARKLVLQGKASQTTPVRDVMTSQVLNVRPQQTVYECMALMSRERIRHLPVIEKGKLVGIISIGDVVQAIITEQEQVIEKLEDAVTGTGTILSGDV